MRRHWTLLTGIDAQVYHTSRTFLDGRLSERGTIDWALKLGPRDEAKRLAVIDILETSSMTLLDPWKTGWRLIDESWESGITDDDNGTAQYEVANRISHGERTGSLVESIVALVKPAAKVEALARIDFSYRHIPVRPKKVSDLMSISLTSGKMVDPDELGLQSINERKFLEELVYALDASVIRGLAIAERLFGDVGEAIWRLGDLRRVYFVPSQERAEAEHEPDEFHKGIAPSVKLLHAVVERLCAINVSSGLPLIQGWHRTSTPVHRRLWSSFARFPIFVSSQEIADYFSTTNEREFWDIHHYPEVSEMRSVRFDSLASEAQAHVIRRLLKGPPSSHWPSKADRELVSKARKYWSARELRRIQLAGGHLPINAESWLRAQLDEFAELKSIARIDEGFLGTPMAQWVAPKPDDRYDFLTGVERLKSLETDLSAKRGGWDDDPSRGAADWIRADGHPSLLISDLEATPDAGGDYPRVWDRFTQAHSPIDGATPASDSNTQEGASRDAQRVLKLLQRLPEKTIVTAIEGITRWFDAWASRLVSHSLSVDVWLRIWPLATSTTNAQQEPDSEPSLSIVAQVVGGDEPKDLDTLNTPAGRLVGAFLSMCPRINVGDAPFQSPNLKRMLDAAMNATGRASLIVHHRFIEQLGYFFLADKEWATQHLIKPLLEEGEMSVFLWRAIARKRRFGDVLEHIGDAMAKRATDSRLGRETRESLAFSIIIDTLHSFNGQKKSAVAHAEVQQMLRLLDDEVRAYAANTVYRFVKDVSNKDGKSPITPPTPASLFRNAVKPFLANVWPQERSLTTPGVSRAFAHLPAVCGDAFVEAVESIERFLVPFDCWSLIDYGLYGAEEGRPKLSKIDNVDKAEALLRLLDATIASAESAVVPSDLGTALDFIQQAAPRLADARTFRRLAALARR